MFIYVSEVSKVQNVIFYSYKELHIATEGFSDSNKIGEGGFGSVYKVVYSSVATFYP